MKNAIVSNLVTVDGFFTDPNGGIDWHNVDQEFKDYADYSVFCNPFNATKTSLLFSRSIIADGLVVGIWRRTQTNRNVVITTNLYTSLGDKELALEQACQRYSTFLQLPVVMS